MRKSSKVISLALSGLMATSCVTTAMVSVSAAASYQSLKDRIAAGHQIVYFRFPTSAWGPKATVKMNAKKHTVNVNCNYYAIWGNQNEVISRAWEAPSTSMYADVAATDDLYFFDITASGQGEMEDGAEYGILFSTKVNAGSADLLQPNTDGYQTCDLYLNTSLLGHTFMVDEPASKATVRENTANSQKIDYLAGSDNGVSRPLRKVSTLCAYIDGMKAGSSPDALEMANALQTYLPNPINEPSFKWNKIEPVLERFGTTAQAVYDLYVEKFGAKVEQGVPYEHVEGADDLKDDGTLKDCFRYVSVTTKEVDDKGVEQEKVTKYPVLDLVKERLNLSKDEPTTKITAVEASMEGTVAATKALPTVTGGNDEYEVSAAWDPADATAAYSTTYTLTATFTAKKGYEFTDATTAKLGDKDFDSVALQDGKLVATASFTTEAESTTAPATEPGTEPVEDTYIVAGSNADIFGTAWDGTNEENTMTKDADGNYTKDYTVTKAFDAVQLKTVKNGAEWIGDKNDQNVTFNLTGAGTFTVVYDTAENYTYVKGDIVEEIKEFKYDTVFAVGNGEGTWLNGAAWDPAYAANEMTKVADDLWEIEFKDVPDGFNRQLKFAIDGAWTHNFGGAFEESGVTSAAAYNGDNVTFDTDDTCTIKAQLDLREFDFATKEGAKFTVTITSDEPEKKAIGIIGDVDGDGQVTINDATEIQKRGVELVNFDEKQEKLADVNGDKRISILDVTCIQKYLAEQTEGIGNTGKTLYDDGSIK